MEDRTRAALTAMRRILRMTEANAKAVQQQTGLSTSQLVLLQLLDERGEQTAGELASGMGITQATLTALIHKLEGRALIVRKKGETDRRQVWISLTGAGRAMLQAAPDGAHEKFIERFEELPGWEKAFLVAALERAAALLGAEGMDAAPVLDAGALDRDRTPLHDA